MDNSPERFTTNWDSSIKVIRPFPEKENIGVARSWNMGVNQVLQSQLDFLVILSASVIFTDGGRSLIEGLKNNYEANGLMTQEGWHCIGINRRVFEKIGNFDTNFYPGYYEDSDFIRRMELAGFHEPTGRITFPGVEIKCQKAEVAHAMKRANIKVNMQACREYFLQKWGADPMYDSQESRDKLFRHPFNDPRLELSYYSKNSITDLKRKYNI